MLKDSIVSATETIIGATSAIVFVLQTPTPVPHTIIDRTGASVFGSLITVFSTQIIVPVTETIICDEHQNSSNQRVAVGLYEIIICEHETIVCEHETIVCEPETIVCALRLIVSGTTAIISECNPVVDGLHTLMSGLDSIIGIHEAMMSVVETLISTRKTDFSKADTIIFALLTSFLAPEIIAAVEKTTSAVPAVLVLNSTPCFPF